MDQEKGKVKGLQVTGAALDASDDPALADQWDHKITIHPDFPSPSSGAADEHLTPFLAAHARYGDAFERRAQQFQFFNAAVKDFADLSRIIRNYEHENWDLFRKGIDEFGFAREWPLQEQVDLNRALYQLLELYMSPFATSENHRRLIQYFTEYTSTIAKLKPAEFEVFLRYLIDSKLLADLQSDLLKLYPKFYALADEIRPIVMEWNPDDPWADFPAGIAVTGKEGFESLKALYVDAYEVIARGLTPIIGLINLRKRGDFHALAPHPNPSISGKKQNAFAPDLAAFHARSHGAKLPLLEEQFRFAAWLRGSLDSRLRNAIGHNTITYDPKTGSVTYYLDRTGTDRETITYGAFLFRVIRAVVRAHQLGHLVKILFVHEYLGVHRK